MFLFLCMASVLLVFGQTREVVRRDGDMLMTETQYNSLFRRSSPGGLQKRKAEANWAERLWPNNTIYYAFKTGFEMKPEELETFNAALAEWSKNTCIKFEKSTTKNHVEIFNGDGCFTYLGYDRYWKRKPMSLSSAGCRTRRTILHEFGHTLGLIHEHKRPGRDDYVTVHRAGNDQYDKVTDGVTFGLPYDLQSIMHYAKNYDMGIKDEERLRDVAWDYNKGLSFTDVAAVNIMYKCGEHCSNTPCDKPGFLDKNCKCVTPWGYAAESCNNLIEDSECESKYGMMKRQFPNCIASGQHSSMVITGPGKDCRKFCGLCYRYHPAEFGLTTPAPTPAPTPTRPRVYIVHDYPSSRFRGATYGTPKNAYDGKPSTSFATNCLLSASGRVDTIHFLFQKVQKLHSVKLVPRRGLGIRVSNINIYLGSEMCGSTGTVGDEGVTVNLNCAQASRGITYITLKRPATPRGTTYGECMQIAEIKVYGAGE